jgi:hypothetical protein
MAEIILPMVEIDRAMLRAMAEINSARSEQAARTMRGGHQGDTSQTIDVRAISGRVVSAAGPSDLQNVLLQANSLQGGQHPNPHRETRGIDLSVLELSGNLGTNSMAESEHSRQSSCFHSSGWPRRVIRDLTAPKPRLPLYPRKRTLSGHRAISEMCR